MVSIIRYHILLAEDVVIILIIFVRRNVLNVDFLDLKLRNIDGTGNLF